MNWFRSKAAVLSAKRQENERNAKYAKIIGEAQSLEVEFVEYLNAAADFASRQPIDEHKKIVSEYARRLGELLQLIFSLIKDSQSQNLGFLQILKIKSAMDKANAANRDFEANFNQFARNPAFEAKTREIQNRLSEFIASAIGETAKGS